MSNSIKIEGLQGTLDALKNLGRREGNRIIRKGLRAGARVMRDAEREEAPKRTLKTSKSIFITGKRAGKGKIAIKVLPNPKAFAGGTYYPAIVAAGHRAGKSGTVVPPNDFPDRAYASAQGRAAQEAADTALSELDQAMKK